MRLRIFFSVLCALALTCSVQADINRAQATYALDYGGVRDSGSIGTALTKIGNAERRIILHGGQWDITNSVTFPTNVFLEIASGSSVLIRTNMIFTVNGGWYAPDAQPVFYGPGTAAGNADFIFRYPEWGDTNQYNIGPGRLPKAVTNLYRGIGPGWHDDSAVILTSRDLVINGGDVLTTNEYSENGGPVVTTNSFVDDLTNLIPTLATNTLQAVMAIVARGYLRDTEVNWVDTNTITIGRGDGYCASNYFAHTVIVTQDLVSLTDQTNIYVYLSETSTFPSTLTFYDSAVLPTWSTVYHAYYHTNGVDRFIGSVPLGGILVTNFDRANGALMWTNEVQIGSLMNPSGTWQTPDDYESSLWLPATATEVFVKMSNTDAPFDDVDLEARRYEAMDAADLIHSGWSATNQAGSLQTVIDSGWVTLGPSRNIRIRGEDGNDNNLNTWILGYKEAR